jgi:hypothetical protein
MLKILNVEYEIKNRLELLDLTKDKLSDVAKRAIAQKSNAVSNHPVNAAGTFAYHEGVKAMRDIFVDGVHWMKLIENGIEYIENPSKNIKVIYQNVDYACDQSHDPQPISKRGGSAKRNAINSNQLDLFGRETPSVNVWVICVSENKGIVNAEISLPGDISKNGCFSQFIERIFILQNHEPENINNKSENNDYEKYDDDIKISLKS